MGTVAGKWLTILLLATGLVMPSAALGVVATHLGTHPGRFPVNKDRPWSKADTGLFKAFLEYQAHRRRFPGTPFRPSNPLLRFARGRILVDAVASGDAWDLQEDLRGYGLRKVERFGQVVSGWLPLGAVKKALQLESVRFISASLRPLTHTGSATSQGDSAMLADVARAEFGVDGMGVTVGVLSDSYEHQGGASDDVASGDLPEGVTVLDDTANCGGLFPAPCSDEGRAMMQIVHDVAPGAALAFHTAFNGMAGFANGIIELADANAKVIVDDVLYYAEPMFQDGIVAQAVDQVFDRGVAYFSAAGNQARSSYESPYEPSGEHFYVQGWFGIEDRGELHDFDPGDNNIDFRQDITVPVGSTIIFSFQWDAPFGQSENDLDIYLLDENCQYVLAESITDNIEGGDPVEILQFVNDGSFGERFALFIALYKGPQPGRMKYVHFGSGGPVEYLTHSATLYGHANAVGAEAIGAAFYGDTPEYGQTPPLLEGFSSAGGTPILFNLDGNRLSVPEVGNKPEVVAPDGVNTTFFYPGRDLEPDGHPNFFGTSAAAPHAAGVAALMLDREPSSSPANIYTALEKTAFDMNTIGFDYDSGYGLVQADLAVAEMGTSTENRPPTVGIDSPLDGASFDSGNGITFSGWANDPEDGDLTAGLVWTSSIDGQIGTGGDFVTRGKNKLSDGVHTITATVTDSYGASGGDQIRINVGNVGNEPPSVTITSPTDGATFQTGSSIEFAGTATDVEDGDLSTGLVWISNVDGQIGTGPSFTKVLNEGSHIIKAKVTDSGGASGSDSISITVGEPSPEPEMVSAIDMSTKMAGPNVNAIATVTIQEANDNNPVDGATVSGTWTGLTNDHDSGVTDASGKVSLRSDKVRNMEGTFTFTIENVVKDGYVYYGPSQTSGSIHTP